MSEIVQESKDRSWVKQDDGSVWMVQLTPYKEIPVIVLDWETIIKDKLTG